MIIIIFLKLSFLFVILPFLLNYLVFKFIFRKIFTCLLSVINRIVLSNRILSNFFVEFFNYDSYYNPLYLDYINKKIDNIKRNFNGKKIYINLKIRKNTILNYNHFGSSVKNGVYIKSNDKKCIQINCFLKKISPKFCLIITDILNLSQIPVYFIDIIDVNLDRSYLDYLNYIISGLNKKFPYDISKYIENYIVYK